MLQFGYQIVVFPYFFSYKERRQFGAFYQPNADTNRPLRFKTEAANLTASLTEAASLTIE